MSKSKDLYGNFFSKINLSIDEWFVDLKNFTKQAIIYKSMKIEVDKIIQKDSGKIYSAKIYKVDINKYSKIEKINLHHCLYCS